MGLLIYTYVLVYIYSLAYTLPSCGNIHKKFYYLFIEGQKDMERISLPILYLPVLVEFYYRHITVILFLKINII